MGKNRFNKQTKSNQNSEVRKDFYKRLFYIGLCIIPIIIFADNKDTFRLVPLPFILFGSYQLIQIIGQLQFVIDDFFPPKTFHEDTTKSFDKFIYYFSTTLFFLGIICLIFEIKNFDNTINGTKLFWIAGLIGIGFATILTIIFKMTKPSIYYESKRRLTVYFGLFGGLFFISTALTGFLNHTCADKIKVCNKYKIDRKGTSSGKSTEYYFFLTVEDNNQERFSVGKTKYQSFEESEEIELCMLKGKFGFNYVIEFNKVTK